MKSNSKILIVDDEIGIRESLKLIIGEHYDLILTESAMQGLEILKNNKDIGLVLMDIKMPKVNGLDALKVMKEQFPKMNVVMVTGYKSVETASEASKLGASGYIVKPFKSDEILETVRKNIK